MSHTHRNITKGWCRKSPRTQQERRQYYAASDQEEAVRVRGNRKLRHLPDDRSELRASSEKERISLDKWLEKQVGKSWNAVLKASTAIPTLKTDRLTHKLALEMIVSAVETQTFMRNGHVWTNSGGNECKLERGLYVHPDTGLLCRM